MPEMTLYALDIHRQKHAVKSQEIHWRPSAYAVIIRADKILLSPQLDGYVLPGGGVELKETLQEALVREVKEETGLDIIPGKQFDFRQNLFVWKPDQPTERYVAHSLCFFFTARIIRGKISTDFLETEEIPFTKAAEWIPLKEIDQVRWTGSIDYLEVVQNYVKRSKEHS